MKLHQLVVTLALCVRNVHADCPWGNQPNNVVGGACDCYTGWTPSGNGQCCSPNAVYNDGSGCSCVSGTAWNGNTCAGQTPSNCPWGTVGTSDGTCVCKSGWWPAARGQCCSPNSQWVDGQGCVCNSGTSWNGDTCASTTPAATVTCQCDTPNTGTANHNHFTCSDGSGSWCAANQACSATQPWTQGDGTQFCQNYCLSVTPTPDEINTLMSLYNTFSSPILSDDLSAGLAGVAFGSALGGFFCEATGYSITNVQSGNCLNIKGAYPFDGGDIIQYSCSDIGENHYWQFASVNNGNFFQMQSCLPPFVDPGAALCLEAKGAGYTDAQLWSKDPSNCSTSNVDQQFLWLSAGNQNFLLYHVGSGQCFGLASDGRVRTKPCNFNDQSQWMQIWSASSRSNLDAGSVVC